MHRIRYTSIVNTGNEKIDKAVSIIQTLVQEFISKYEGVNYNFLYLLLCRHFFNYVIYEDIELEEYKNEIRTRADVPQWSHYELVAETVIDFKKINEIQIDYTVEALENLFFTIKFLIDLDSDKLINHIGNFQFYK